MTHLITKQKKKEKSTPEGISYPADRSVSALRGSYYWSISL